MSKAESQDPTVCFAEQSNRSEVVDLRHMDQQPLCDWEESSPRYRATLNALRASFGTTEDSFNPLSTEAVSARGINEGGTQDNSAATFHHQNLFTSSSASFSTLASLPEERCSTHREYNKKRSAVENARLRAQREAEAYAKSRKSNSEKQASASKPNKTTIKRSKKQKGTTGESKKKSEASNKSNETYERKESDTYERRLALNRESAAVSRLRRRTYVKELEERLAVVEASKLQLEGKLEAVQEQNEDMKRQLEFIFLSLSR